MVRYTEDKKIFIKILYWGCAAGGKTTAVDTLYQVCSEQDKDVIPTGTLKKIAMASGSTLYFDRGIFQNKREKMLYYHVFTVAGQQRFGHTRKVLFEDTDGVIFVVDSQKSRLQDNINSLKELKQVAEGKLISVIPLLVMLNKRDLDDIFSLEEWEQQMKELGLFHEPPDPLSEWNPLIYETVALHNNAKNVYRIFSECARRCVMYTAFGDGKAPPPKKVGLSPDVPDL
jgi:signal recognition particle receptor subunit beta